MHTQPVIIKKHFTVISETNVNITKAVTLAHNVFAGIDILCTTAAKHEEKEIELVIDSYNEYEYITETQYKKILVKLTAEGKADFSANASPKSVLDSFKMTDLIRAKATLVSKITQMPVLSPSFGATRNKELVDNYRKLYKHYEYMLDVVFADVLDSGGRMTPLQMKQMNVINKEINKKKLWDM